MSEDEVKEKEETKDAKRKKTVSYVLGVSLLIMSIILMAGVKTVFSACAVNSDNIMSCHWAQEAVFCVSIILILQSLLLLIIPGKQVKTGLALAMIPTAALMAVIPGTLINLCMMADMRCHAYMRPFVIVMAVLIIIVAVVDSLTNLISKAVSDWKKKK